MSGLGALWSVFISSVRSSMASVFFLTIVLSVSSASSSAFSYSSIWILFAKTCSFLLILAACLWCFFYFITKVTANCASINKLNKSSASWAISFLPESCSVFQWLMFSLLLLELGEQPNQFKTTTTTTTTDVIFMISIKISK